MSGVLPEPADRRTLSVLADVREARHLLALDPFVEDASERVPDGERVLDLLDSLLEARHAGVGLRAIRRTALVKLAAKAVAWCEEIDRDLDGARSRS